MFNITSQAIVSIAKTSSGLTIHGNLIFYIIVPYLNVNNYGKVNYSLVAINLTNEPLPPSIRSLKEVPGCCCSIYNASIMASGNRFLSAVRILVL